METKCFPIRLGEKYTLLSTENSKCKSATTCNKVRDWCENVGALLINALRK